MLSEHETLELLAQLKQGSSPTGGSDYADEDSVGHWPVLIGGGMCLNLQTVASLELNNQPDSIVVLPSGLDTASYCELAERYAHVDHLSSGVDGRTAVIAYSRTFAQLLLLLQATASDFTVVQASEHYSTDRQSEFSQAIATSLDPGPAMHLQPHGLSYPASDTQTLALVGSWCLQITYRDIEAEIFIGLTGATAGQAGSKSQRHAETFSIDVRPLSAYRTCDAPLLNAELEQPASVLIETKRDDNGESAAGDEAPDSIAQGLLQLCADDLYLLLVEAIGTGSALTFKFAIEQAGAPLDADQLLRDGCNHQCLSINDLPLRYATLQINDGRYLLTSHE